MRRFASLVLALCLTAGLAPRDALAAPAKTPLGYRAYDSWNAIRGTKLSDDGVWLAYALVPQDGDSVLVVRNLNTGAEIRQERGLTPLFTPDSKFLVYTVRAKNDEIHKAEREHKTPAESPKNGLGIVTLATGAVVTYERVKSVKVPHDIGSSTIAFSFETAPAARASGAPAVAAAPTPVAPPSPSELTVPAQATPSATPGGASPSPTSSPDDLHKAEDGTDLVIRDLAAASDTRVRFVSDYAIAHDGAFAGYATQSKDGKRNGVRVRSASGVTTDLLLGDGHYSNLTFAPQHERLAFESDMATYANKAPSYDLYRVDLSAAGRPMAKIVAARTTAGLPPRWTPNPSGKLRFSKDGARLFLGTAPAPTPVPSGTPEPMKVDIWSWRDVDLQSSQRIHAGDERKRTYAAVVHDGEDRPVQLGTPALRTVITNENPDIAIATGDESYRKLFSWEGLIYRDVYAVSLRDGSRRLLGRKRPDTGALSPDGRYLVNYDLRGRYWYSQNTHTGTILNLTTRLHVPFYDELNDVPSSPEPYGFGGFVDGSRYALLRDRYDVWAIDPATGNARNVTAGIGRARHLRFAPVELDLERDSFASEKPLVLAALDDRTKDAGLYESALQGPQAFRPRRLVMLSKYLANFQQARNADRFVTTEQRFDEPANLWSGASIEAPLQRVSDANPQKERYRWGQARLISYTSRAGVPLRGILLTPDGLAPRKKYPMLVYFYERYADFLHHPPLATLPGPSTGPNLLRYVSNGYVVLIPDVAYRTGHPGKSALDSVLPAVDAVLRLGFVDPARIGVAGHSWGAYQIAYMITQTNRFRAAEAGAAVADMVSAYGGIRWGEGVVREFQYEHGQSRIGAAPWDRLDLYVENSPIFHIKSIRTPYMTIANDNDDAVPWYQGIEFVTALRRLGKEAYMFQFDGEFHNLRGREAQKYWTVHLDEFFDHFLLGSAAPSWMNGQTPFLRRGERDLRALFGEPIQ